jgi:pimeloyl-ACP methyl ester carboxylesterase
MGAILALHHAAQHPHAVLALALYAPSLSLDGWGIPWYSHFFKLITQKWLAQLFPFAERDPRGIKAPPFVPSSSERLRRAAALRCGLDASSWDDAVGWPNATDLDKQRIAEQQSLRNVARSCSARKVQPVIYRPSVVQRSMTSTRPALQVR